MEYIGYVRAKAILNSQWDWWDSGTERLSLPHRPTDSNRPASLDRCLPPSHFPRDTSHAHPQIDEAARYQVDFAPYTAAVGAGPRFAGGTEVVRVLRDGIRGRTLVQIRFGTFGGSVRNSVLAMPEYRRRRPNSVTVGIYGTGFDYYRGSVRGSSSPLGTTMPGVTAPATPAPAPGGTRRRPSGENHAGRGRRRRGSAAAIPAAHASHRRPAPRNTCGLRRRKSPTATRSSPSDATPAAAGRGRARRCARRELRRERRRGRAAGPAAIPANHRGRRPSAPTPP